MGACCCRPKSPCGSLEERSGLLKDDTKLAGPAGNLSAPTGGTRGPQKEDDIRKMSDTVVLKAEDMDDPQLKLLGEFDACEPTIARVNGSLLKDGAKASHEASAALRDDGVREETSSHRQRQDGDRRPASPARFAVQDGGRQEAPRSPGKDEGARDLCRRGEDGDAGSGVNQEEAPFEEAGCCQEKTAEPNSLVSGDTAGDGSVSALLSREDEKSHEASMAATQAKPDGEERRPEPAIPAQILSTASDVADSLQSQNMEQHAGEDHDQGRSAATREEEEEEMEKMADTEVAQDRPTRGSLRSSEEDLYQGEEELPLSHHQNQAAPLEGSELEARCSLGPPVDILSYSQREWRGNTAKSALIRKGYRELSRHFAAVRQVRGDNYCALRATLFQVLSQASQGPAWLQDEDDVAALWRDLSEFTGDWTLPGEAEAQADVTRQLRSHLEVLRNKWRAAASCPSAAERRRLCDDAFRGGEEEAAMLEALKLLMLRRAAGLHAAMGAGRDVPLFCWLLFARDTSNCPRAFLANHLSRVGVGAGLEQVEMCLLGDTLRCTLQVYRLYMADTEEFVAYYPEEHKDDWPRVSLVTEDDRHYNVPVAGADPDDREDEMGRGEEVAALAS